MSNAGNRFDRNPPTQRRDHMPGSCLPGCDAWDFAFPLSSGRPIRSRTMARLSEHGLRRSVGVPGLFATAYGNVGSSIYYALGLVVAHALGLTPLVFLFAGGLFALTAKTYAEGAAMNRKTSGVSPR